MRDIYYVLFISMLFFSSNTFSKDRIVLSNSDVITGDIISKENLHLSIKTEHSGVINVYWNKIKSIHLSSYKLITLKNNKKISGTIQFDSGGHFINLSKTKTREKVTLSQIASIGVVNKVDDSYKLSGYFKLAANQSSGNTNTKNLMTDLEVIYKNNKNRYTLGFTNNLTEESDIEILANTRYALKYDRFISEKRFLYAQSTAYEDEFKDIKLQLTLGAGFGYQFWSNAEKHLSIEGGLSYVDETLVNAPDRDYSAFRWGLRYEKKLNWLKVKFFHKQEGLWDLDNTDNINVNAQTGFNIPVLKRLELALQVNVNWDAEPEVGKEEADELYLFSLGYKW